MANKCIGPGCKGNYNNGPKVSVFSFSKEPARRKKWIDSIPRKDLPDITDHSVVCHRHFAPYFLITETKFNLPDGTEMTLPRKVNKF